MTFGGFNKICLLALLMQFPAFLIAAEQVYPIVSGDWEGGRYDDADGSFSHCAVAARYESGIFLVINYASDLLFSLSLVKDEWELPVGDSYYVRIFVDRHDLGMYTALAMTNNGLKITAEHADQLVERLQKGKSLQIQAAKQDLYFDLTGTFRAIEKLKACVYSALSDSRPSDSSTANNPFASDDATNRYGDSDTREFIESLLKVAGNSTVEFLDKQSNGFDNAAAIWETGSTFGILYEMAEESPVAMQNQLKTMQQNLSNECDGIFSVSEETTSRVGKYSIIAYRAFCDGKSGDGFYSIINIIIDNEAMLILHTVSDAKAAYTLKMLHTNLLSSVTEYAEGLE